jgi:Tol biopolymer transport system component
MDTGIGRKASTTLRTAWTLVLAGILGSALAAQGPARATYYSVPSWAPDGKTIAFESNRDGQAAVYTIQPDGSGLRRLTPAGTLGEQPNWTPDGRRIVFASVREGARQLFLMNAGGGTPTALPGTANGFLAAFSPDGRWLLFAAQDKRPSMHYRVFVMRPDGSERRELGDSAKSNEDPRWSVDGARVVFMESPLLEMLPAESPRDFVRRRARAQQWKSITPKGRKARALEPDEAERISRDRGLSPDGRWRVLAKPVEGVAALVLQEAATGAERLLDGGAAGRERP